MEMEDHRLYLVEEALGGLSAGIIGTLIGYPLDVVKTRLQTGMASSSSSSSSLGGGGQQRQQGTGGILSIGKRIVHTEGISGLYRGVGPPLVSLTILNTTTFTQYTYYREKLFLANPGWDYRNFLAGVSCAPFSGLVSTVENLIKTQMQLDNLKQPRKEYSGSLDCVSTLLRRHGVSILYTGHVVNTIREASFLGPYFFFYEGFRETFRSISLHPSGNSSIATSSRSSSNNNKAISVTTLAVPLAGGLSGALSWFISFPLDCIRAGVQGQALPPTKGAIRVFFDLLKHRGVRGLYAGSSASIARAFLVSGSRFSAYEGALWLLRGGRHYERHHD